MRTTRITSVIRAPGFAPALRTDIRFCRGEPPVVVVIDPVRDRRYELYDVECLIIKAMDGARDLDALTRVAQRHVASATRDQVAKLAAQAAGMGLLSNVEPEAPLGSSNNIGRPGQMPSIAPDWDGAEPTLITPAPVPFTTGYDQPPMAFTEPLKPEISLAGYGAPAATPESVEPESSVEGVPPPTQEPTHEPPAQQPPADEPEASEPPTTATPPEARAKEVPAGSEPWEIERPPWYARKRVRRGLYLGTPLFILVALAIIPYPLYVTEECMVRPAERAEVRAPFDGIVAEIFVAEGDAVKAGSPLARFDDRQVSHERRQAKAEVDRLKANLSMLQKGSRPEDIRRARALVQAKAKDVRFARKEAQRERRLFRQGLSSATQRDAARRDLEVKQAALSQARAQLQLVQAGARPEAISMAEAKLEGAEAKLDYLIKKEHLLVLRSPIAGTVLTPNFRERLHELVRAGELVCEVGNSDTVRVEIYVPERYADVIRVGHPVIVKVRSFPLEPFEGTVAFIAPAVEERDGERVLRVEAELKNPRGMLQPHMTGYAEINTGDRSILNLVSRRVIRWIRVRFMI